MSATIFEFDTRDHRFLLHEQLKIAEVLSKYEHFADVDTDLCDTMLEEGRKIAVEVLAPLNTNADRQGCTLDKDGNITTPDGFKEAWNLLSQGGWLGITANPEVGGMGMPHALGSAIGEMVTSSCMGFSLYGGLTAGAASLLEAFAAEPTRTMVCEKLYSGEWTGTMCLTEAGAGSAVGDIRARATPLDEPGAYHLEGEKVFISSGDHDLSENVIHLVLARTPGAPTGTGGLSIFLVPKFHFDNQGKIGQRNGIRVVGIEEKMGLHGNGTCTLSLGADQPCVGYLLGKEYQGIRIMFHMMNEARIEVGVQGLAGASAGYQYALSYAKERLQGPSLDEITNPEAKSVAIIQHPDVRRMLMWQKVHVETMRSLVCSTSLMMDEMHQTEDPKHKQELKGQVELLTPIIKAYCSDKGFESTVLALQTLGGYGYIQEYPVEQLIRDTKIASLYEGTNGIQAMDLLGRKMRKAGGALFMTWLNTLNEEIEACRGIDELAQAIVSTEKARDSLGAAAMHLGGLGMQGNLSGAMLQATPFLEQFGCVALGYHALVQARVAHGKLNDCKESDKAYYLGKICNAQFYASNVLPRAISLGKSIRSDDESCLKDVVFGE